MGLNRAVVLAVCAGLTCGQSMDWASISPGDAGLDAAKLEAWRSSLAAHRTTGLIVIRRGRIALEWYAPEWDANRPHGTASMDRKSTRLNSSHLGISYAVFCLKKKKTY